MAPEYPGTSANLFEQVNLITLFRYKYIYIYIYTVDVLFFAGTYFRGQLSPNQFAGIKMHATSTVCDISWYILWIFKFVGINIRGDHVTVKINTQRNILHLLYIGCSVCHCIFTNQDLAFKAALFPVLLSTLVGNIAPPLRGFHHLVTETRVRHLV